MDDITSRDDEKRLELARETGIRNEKQLEYWDNLVITNGNIITAKREEFINFLNSSAK